ncbi:hypothetical protein Droror1_Dr00009107 [Drosera rotundifolia]
MGGLYERMANLVGEKFGRLIEANVDGKGRRNGQKLRLKVELRINRPLLRGMFLKIQGSDQRWEAFRYERLQNFCFECGESPIWGMDPNGIRQGEMQYGTWLKAMPPRKGSVGFVVVNNQHGTYRSEEKEDRMESEIPTDEARRQNDRKGKIAVVGIGRKIRSNDNSFMESNDYGPL